MSLACRKFTIKRQGVKHKRQQERRTARQSRRALRRRGSGPHSPETLRPAPARWENLIQRVPQDFPVIKRYPRRHRHGRILTPPPERRIHPAAPVPLARLPDESGVPVGSAIRLGGGAEKRPTGTRVWKRSCSSRKCQFVVSYLLFCTDLRDRP